MAKAPKPGTTRPAPPETVFEFGFNGEKWQFRVSDVSIKDAADLRKEIRVGPRELIGLLAHEGVDLDVAAGCVFLARRQSDNPRISWALATAGLTYSTPFVWGVVEAEDDSPE